MPLLARIMVTILLIWFPFSVSLLFLQEGSKAYKTCGRIAAVLSLSAIVIGIITVWIY